MSRETTDQLWAAINYCAISVSASRYGLHVARSCLSASAPVNSEAQRLGGLSINQEKLIKIRRGELMPSRVSNMNSPPPTVQQPSFFNSSGGADANSHDALSVLQGVDSVCHGILTGYEHTRFDCARERRDGASFNAALR
jgi:hypothetical protein